MRRLILALVLLIGCGNTAPPAAQPIANAAPPDAGPGALPADAASSPAPQLLTGGCCQDGMWVCDRMPREGECPRGWTP